MSRLGMLLMVLSGLALSIIPAQAQIYYPWCANYGGDMGGVSNCGFVTREQCLATISGNGGTCDPNPFYVQPPSRPAKRVRKRNVS